MINESLAAYHVKPTVDQAEINAILWKACDTFRGTIALASVQSDIDRLETELADLKATLRTHLQELSTK